MADPEHDEPADDDPAALPDTPPSDSLRRRLDEVFGAVLPEITRDEQHDTTDEPSTAADEWLRANRPPHHGG